MARFINGLKDYFQSNPDKITDEVDHDLKNEQTRHEEKMRRLNEEHEKAMKKYGGWGKSMNRSSRTTTRADSSKITGSYGQRHGKPGYCLIIDNANETQKHQVDNVSLLFARLGFRLDIRCHVPLDGLRRGVRRMLDQVHDDFGSIVCFIFAEGNQDQVIFEDNKKLHPKEIVNAFRYDDFDEVPTLLFLQLDAHKVQKSRTRYCEESTLTPKYRHGHVVCSTHPRFISIFCEKTKQHDRSPFQSVLDKVVDALLSSCNEKHDLVYGSTLEKNLYLSKMGGT